MVRLGSTLGGGDERTTSYHCENSDDIHLGGHLGLCLGDREASVAVAAVLRQTNASGIN